MSYNDDLYTTEVAVGTTVCRIVPNGMTVRWETCYDEYDHDQIVQICRRKNKTLFIGENDKYFREDGSKMIHKVGKKRAYLRF